MKKKYRVNLSAVEQEQVLSILHAPETTKTFRNRANILLMADESQGIPPSQDEISKRCGVSDLTVFNTIKSYSQTGIDKTLHFKPWEKPSNPPKITGEKEARIIALACGRAPEGRSRWTVRLLAESVVKLEILDSVCPETIRSALKKHNLSLI